jgi:hypothetical protein
VYGSPDAGAVRGSETLVLGSNVPLVLPRIPAAAPAPLPIPKPVPKADPPVPKPTAPAPKREQPKEAPKEAVPRSRRRRPVSHPEDAERKRPEPERSHAPSKRPADRKLVMGVALGAIVLLLIATLAIVLRPQPPDVRGFVTYDMRGRPLVELSCGDCEKETEVTLQGKTTRLPGRLPLDSALSLGEHPLPIELKAPGMVKKRLDLPLRVAFTISADLSGLTKPTPTLSVVVDAAADAGVIVDGKVLAGNAGSPRRYEVDVSSALTGEESAIKTLVRRVPYTISLPGVAPTRGEIELEASIVPLAIEAPGESITIEAPSFMLAGATQPNGSISVEGRAITVDPSGRFAQLMNVSSVGNTTVMVRASAPGRAPRLAPIRVRRVPSLAEEAKLFQAKATRSYAALIEDADKKLGWSVALSGKIDEVRPEGFATALMLAVDKPCASEPCLVRLTLGEKTSFAAGNHISAYGYLTQPWKDAQGRTLPQVRVEFLRGDE